MARPNCLPLRRSTLCRCRMSAVEVCGGQWWGRRRRFNSRRPLCRPLPIALPQESHDRHSGVCPPKPECSMVSSASIRRISIAAGPLLHFDATGIAVRRLGRVGRPRSAATPALEHVENSSGPRVEHGSRHWLVVALRATRRRGLMRLRFLHGLQRGQLTPENH